MKAMESQRKATVDELMMKNQELEKMEKNKYAELEKKFVMVEKEYSYLKSLYDAEDDEVVASDAIVSGDESDAENEQTKKRCVEDNTQQVGGSMASKKQKTQDTPLSNSYAFSYEYNKDGPFVDDKDACADLQRLVKDIPYDFPLVHELEESEAYKDMAHAIAQMTAKANSVIWLYDRRLKMALGIRTEWSEDEFLTDLLEEEAVLDKSRAWTKVICSTNRIVWWYDRKLKAAQGVKKELSRVRENLRVEKRKSLLRKKSVKELSKKSEALQAENFQFATELIGSKETVAALKAEKARLVDKLVSNVRKSMDSLTSQIEGSK
ncbi:unnamed protein product [Microthlaspi erraticum]|uniref:Uncharacterized protein n=1 Tax=Microthlaspi erraticum TaxID=1685480 RepID=A0A6D2JPZ6_9BRAS|nr:unnamed protein product [Microthlaspi erraticum]